MKTRSATLLGAKHLEMVETEMPPLARGMVRIRFRAGGICGSDLHYYKHARTSDFVVSEPLVLGHEVCGEIAEIFPSVDGLMVGDRVTINPSRWCGHCGPCRAGEPNLCQNIFFMGSASKVPHMQGGFSTYFDALPVQCHALAVGTSFEAAALTEPLAVCLHALSRAGTLAGHRIAIQGAGPIGLLTLLAARHKGAEDITVIDIADTPLAFATKLGATETINVKSDPDAIARIATDDPFDILFEVTGTPIGFGNALQMVRRGGTVIQIGNLPAGTLAVPISSIMSKELNIKGSFRFGYEFAEAVDLINTGQIDVLAIVTDRAPLSEAPAAFETAQDRERQIKVVLVGSS